MTDIARTSIAAELALVTRVNRTPVAPLGYGTDLSCASDLTPTMDVVDPFSTLALGQAIARRLDTPRGSLIDDPDYGISLSSYLNRGVSITEINNLSNRVRSEVEKDDRVVSALVTVTHSLANSTLSVSVQVTPADPRTNTFALVLAVTSAAVLIEELR